MKFVQALAVVAVVIAASGCAIKYQFDGKQYNSKEEMLAATDSAASTAIAGIAPLPMPVTKRALVFAIPSHETMIRVSQGYHQTQTGSAPNALVVEMLDNITASNFKMIKVFYDGVVRRNIYSAVQLVETDTATPNLQPSANRDVLYHYESGPGSANWFYATEKTGRQILPIDRTAPTPAGKVQAFVEAVQLQAIKD